MSTRSASVRAKTRKTPRRSNRSRSVFSSWRARSIFLALFIGVAVLAWATIIRFTAPLGNTSQSRFDAIVVLGGGVDWDGNLRPATLARITEAVREYERGIAPRLIMSGGIAHDKFPEAYLMARAAEAQGVPQSAIFIEPEAKDTIQNACFSVRLMKAHGWASAEIVTTPSHLRRAALIFSQASIFWHMHQAPPLEWLSPWKAAFYSGLEILKTARYLVYARWTERCSP